MSPATRAIVLVDHGSRRAEANEQLEALAQSLRAREPATLVLTAHLEVLPPGLADALDACARAGVRDVVVLPWFLAAGRHTRDDIPQQVADAAARHPELRVQIGEPLGLHAKLVEVALERIEAARSAQGPPE